MGKKCVVPKCKSGLATCSERVSLFGIPKNKLELWQKALPGKNRQLTYKDAVCEKHFRPSDIIREVKTPIYSYTLRTPKLAPDAIPSLFRISRNYQLRTRSSNTANATTTATATASSSKERNPDPLESMILTRDQISRPLTHEEQLETVSEVEFTVKLQKSRKNTPNSRSLTKQKYNDLISQVLNAKQKNLKLILKKYDVIFESNGAKVLTTADKNTLHYYIHDEELFYILRAVHLLFKHGDQLQMMAELHRKYKNVSGRDVATFISLCHTCNPRNRALDEDLVPNNLISTELSSICSVNFINYLSVPDGNFGYVMVYQNHSTKFCLLKALKNDASAEVANHLMDIFAFFGTSKEIHSDKPSFFWRRVIDYWKTFIVDLDIDFVKTYPSNPVVREVDLRIREWMMYTGNTKWVERLPIIQLTQNREFNTHTEEAPYFDLFKMSVNPKNIFEEFGVAPSPICSSDNEMASNYKLCVLCRSVVPNGESCSKCLAKETIRNLLPSSYQIWGDPSKESPLEDEFLASIKRLKFNSVFSKHRYEDIIDRLSNGKDVDDPIIKNFSLVEVKGSKRLASTVVDDNIRYYVRDDELFYVLHYTHINLNHATPYKMLVELKSKFQNIFRKDVRTYVSLCPKCQIAKGKKRSLEPVVFSEMSSSCSVKLMEYDLEPDGDFKYVMVYQNLLTKFCMLEPLKTITLEEVGCKLLDIFTVLGAPKIIASRRDINFEDEVIKGRFLDELVKKMRLLWLDLDIKHVKFADELEDVDYIEEDLREWMKINRTVEWVRGLPFVQLMRNRRHNVEIERAPYDALFGFRTENQTNIPEKDENAVLLNLLKKLYLFEYPFREERPAKYTFWKKMHLNRKKAGNSNDCNFPKDVYKNLLVHVAEAKKNKKRNILDRYGAIKFQGVERLIEPLSKGSIRFYVHDEELLTIFRYTHTRLKHADVPTMKKEIEKRFVNISTGDLQTFYSLCSTCARNNPRKSINCPTVETLMSYKCSVNIIECADFDSRSDGDFNHVLLYQNHLTKFCLLTPLKTKTPYEIAVKLLDVFTFVGNCMAIESQEGGTFVKKIAAALKFLWFNVDVKYGGRGDVRDEAERVKTGITGWMEEHDTKEWSKSLPFVQLAINKEDRMGSAPYEKIFNVYSEASSGGEWTTNKIAAL